MNVENEANEHNQPSSVHLRTRSVQSFMFHCKNSQLPLAKMLQKCHFLELPTRFLKNVVEESETDVFYRKKKHENVNELPYITQFKKHPV